MKYFGTQTYYSLDKSKPYQRPKLRHAGPTSVNREAELDRPSRVACSELLGDWSLIFLPPRAKCRHQPARQHQHGWNNNNSVPILERKAQLSHRVGCLIVCECIAWW